MTCPRFRLVAGPNGSGKTTLVKSLVRDYAVNFYDMLNADDIFAEVRSSSRFAPHILVENDDLLAYARDSSYPAEVRRSFENGDIEIVSGIVRFRNQMCVNSYTIALLTNFLQSEYIKRGMSFSQETVFSHTSKVRAIAAAQAAGFRTYLYFVSTDNPAVNVARVFARSRGGGHDVPEEKVISRYERSTANVSSAFAHLSRAFFFDNGGANMDYLASWNPKSGMTLQVALDNAPMWFRKVVHDIGCQRPKCHVGVSGITPPQCS